MSQRLLRCSRILSLRRGPSPATTTSTSLAGTLPPSPPLPHPVSFKPSPSSNEVTRQRCASSGANTPPSPHGFPRPRRSVCNAASSFEPAEPPPSLRISGPSQMLSRYRSVSVVAPRSAAYNNPVQRFEEAAEQRNWILHERAGDVGPPGSFATALRLWDGPLAGIAHQDGQFLALEEGPAAEAVQLPSEELAWGLSQDLELLIGLARLTRDVLYSAYGSESDFNVVPIILEPKLATMSGAERPATGIIQMPITQPSNLQLQPPERQEPAFFGRPATPDLRQPTAAKSPPANLGGGSSAGDSHCGGWWPLEEAVATPLTWEEVATSLGVAPELAAQMQSPQYFDSKQAFWRHMVEKHFSIMEGGAELICVKEEENAGAAEPPAPGVPDDLRFAGAAAGSVVESAAAGGVVQEQQQRQQQPQQHEYDRFEQQRSSAAGLAAAARELSGAVVFPAVWQVLLGSEALGWNPVPLMWLGRSRRSGAILGLMTGVVWT